MARKAANKSTKAAAAATSKPDATSTKSEKSTKAGAKPSKSTKVDATSTKAEKSTKADAKSTKAEKSTKADAKSTTSTKSTKADAKSTTSTKSTKKPKARSDAATELAITAAERLRVVAKVAARDKNKPAGPLITVRHMQRRDIDRVWDFLKLAFREVNIETVEYQRPRSKHRFEEIYEEEGIEQLVFEVDSAIVAYAECSFEPTGADNWINPRYFEKREMHPLFVDELAVHPDWHGRGVGSFLLEQLHHLARVHGLNHIVLEVAENNENAFEWYKKRHFKKLDAAIFMAVEVEIEPELLPPRELPTGRRKAVEATADEPSE